MRGEHRSYADSVRYWAGSSPHARGAPAGGRPRASQSGIIPACAGSTKAYKTFRQVYRDHPRMRGEHFFSETGGSMDEGSSPHARGARGRPVRRVGQRGIIPACAGSTCGPRSSPRTSRDHPRMRGEHGKDGLTMCRCQGSSPHARGALAGRRRRRRRAGIIPACAGSTLRVAVQL